MAKRDSPSSGRDVFNEPEIRAKLNIEDLVWRQIDRTNVSASYDESAFAANVRILMTLLPKHKLLELVDRSDEYTDESEYYQYNHFCGVPMGTPEKPVAGSPFLVQDSSTDWYTLYEFILEAFEDSGISWKIDRQSIEIGKLNKFSKEPTPYFIKDEEDAEDNEKEDTVTDEKEDTVTDEKNNSFCGVQIGTLENPITENPLIEEVNKDPTQVFIKPDEEKKNEGNEERTDKDN